LAETAAPVDRPRVRYQGHFRHASGEEARQFLTHIDRSLFHISSDRLAIIATPGKKQSSTREDTMKTNYKVAIALVAGAAIGGAAIQGLHAQAKPPAYIVIPILKINDAAAFKAGVVDKATVADLTAAGGHYVIRSQKFTSLNGDPPARLVVLAFDSVEKAQAFSNTAAQKEINAARMNSTNSLSFIVEGFAN
jgi:uncharacterized protein (DUF1330 family)